MSFVFSFLAYKNTPFPKQYTILSNKWGAVQNTTEILKSAIYFTGVDETFVDNLISTIGAHASNNDIEGIKEEVQKYVAYRTRQK